MIGKLERGIANVKKAIAKIPWDDWQGKSNEGLVQIAEIKLKLYGWSCERRVIVERTPKPLIQHPKEASGSSARKTSTFMSPT